MQIVISSTGALEFTQFKYMLIFGACYTLNSKFKLFFPKSITGAYFDLCWSNKFD